MTVRAEQLLGVTGWGDNNGGDSDCCHLLLLIKSLISSCCCFTLRKSLNPSLEADEKSLFSSQWDPGITEGAGLDEMQEVV